MAHHSNSEDTNFNLSHSSSKDNFSLVLRNNDTTMGEESHAGTFSTPLPKRDSPDDNDGLATDEITSSTTGERCLLLLDAPFSRDLIPSPIKIEDDTDVTDDTGQGEQSDSEDDDNLPSNDKLPRERSRIGMEYLTTNKAEVSNWQDGNVYKPEQHEPRRVLISSLEQFLECGDECNTIVNRLKEELKSIEGSEHVLQFLRDAVFLSSGECQRIGLQGPAASGKSSLLNALLNIPDLALADGGSWACSRYPIEYTSPQPGQTQTILVRIQLFNKQDRHAFIKEELEAYRHEMEGATEDDDEEFERNQTRCKEALDVFSALFSNKYPFMGSTEPQEFLCQQPLDYILGQMEGWLAELLKAKNIESEEVQFSAATTKDLHKLLEPFVGSINASRHSRDLTSLWPIVRSIKIHVDSLILTSGVVLVDVPGMNDTNMHRVKVSESYLKDCSHVVVVANQRRIHSDRDAQEHIEKAAKRVGSDMIVAITHNDDAARCKSNATLFEEDEVLAEIEIINSEIAEQIRQFRKLSKLQKHQRLEELKSHKSRKNLLPSMRFGRKLDLTAGMIKEDLRKVYGRTISKKSVDIIGVSNTVYMDLADTACRPARILPPSRTTGIPALRKAIRRLGERPTVDHLSGHIHSVLPNALTNVLLWCDPTQCDLLEMARPALDDSRRGCTNIVNKLVENLQRLAFKHTTDSIEKNTAEWMISSKAAVEEYIGEIYQGRKVHVTSAKAFITKHGCHTRAKKPRVNINEQLIQPLSKKLDEDFKVLRREVSEHHEKARLDLIENCDGLFKRIERSEVSLFVASKRATLHQKQEAVKSMITKIFKDADKAFLRFLRELRRAAVDTVDDSCIMKTLDPIYSEITRKFPRRKGYCRCIQSEFWSFLEKEELYSEYLNYVDEFVTRELPLLLDKSLKSTIGVLFQDLHTALKDFCTPPEITQEEKERRAGIAESLKKHMKVLEDDIGKKFHACCDNTTATTNPDSPQTGQKRKRND